MCAYCFWVQNPARTCLFDTVRLLFLGKNPPRVIIKSRVFIKFWLLSQFFFGLFHQYFPNFSLFYANFIHFPHLVPLANWQKLHYVFIPSCVFIKILVFFHPVCLFSTVRLLKLGGIFHPVRLFHTVLLFDSVE